MMKVFNSKDVKIINKKLLKDEVDYNLIYRILDDENALTINQTLKIS